MKLKEMKEVLDQQVKMGRRRTSNTDPQDLSISTAETVKPTEKKMSDKEYLSYRKGILQRLKLLRKEYEEHKIAGTDLLKSFEKIYTMCQQRGVNSWD